MSHQLHIIKERNEYSINQEQSWKVDYGYKGYGFAIKRDDNSIVCNFPDGLRPEQKALAQMISATPDLLEAAIQLVEWYGRSEGGDGALFPINYQTFEIQRAMKAIAKATGGSHD